MASNGTAPPPRPRRSLAGPDGTARPRRSLAGSEGAARRRRSRAGSVGAAIPSQEESPEAQENLVEAPQSSCLPGMEPMLNVIAVKIVKGRGHSMVTGLPVTHAYDIFDMNDIRLFYVTETGKGTGPEREFDISIFDASGHVVFKFQRKHGGCCSCGKNSVQVYTANGLYIGQLVDAPRNDFCMVEDASHFHVLSVTHKHTFREPQQIFEIIDMTPEKNTTVGALHNKFPNSAFGFQLDHEIEPNLKCLLLAAAFYFNTRFFETVVADLQS